jgi:hypothetical protein
MTYHTAPRPAAHPIRRFFGLRGLGTVAYADYPASQVQTALMHAGFSVGSTGADNNFGTNSQAALHQALQFLMLTDAFTVSPDKRTVSMDPASFAAITSPTITSQVTSVPTTPTRPTSSASHVVSSTPAPLDTTAAVTPSTGTNWGAALPWIIGGVGIAAVGGLFLYQSKKHPKAKPTVKNARRRSGPREALRRAVKAGTPIDWARIAPPRSLDPAKIQRALADVHHAERSARNPDGVPRERAVRDAIADHGLSADEAAILRSATHTPEVKANRRRHHYRRAA